jgi:hypothetical protein
MVKRRRAACSFKQKGLRLAALFVSWIPTCAEMTILDVTANGYDLPFAIYRSYAFATLIGLPSANARIWSTATP